VVGRLAGAAALVAVAAAQTGTKPQRYKGLEISVTGIERADNAALSDCPPGANTQRAMAKPNEQFAIVSLAISVLPDYKEIILKKPVLHDAAGASYNTAASFVDVGKEPKYTCRFPFRVPTGTKLKTLDVDGVTFDVAALEGK
jgi:hypothetical protein